MSGDTRVQTLTINLARHSLAASDLVKPSARLNSYRLTVNESTTGELFVQSPQANSPDWAEFFDGYLPSETFGKNSSAGAALVLKVREKLFAITFGTGRFLLAPDAWEERFGLRVALNCIPENMVRSIDKHSLDQLLRHSREQASREATPSEFGFDIEQDLLRAVTGKPTDNKTYGQRISGSDSLHLTVPLHLNQLPELLDNLYDRFTDTSYRTKFPWVDQIGEVTDSGFQQELDDALISRIASGQTGHIWMAVPELISWAKVSGFRFPTRGQSPQFPEFMDESEGHYLKRAVASDPKRFVLMDQKMVSHGGGHSLIEFCDLFSADEDIFHFKRYGQSSALSHLFAQGLVSGELFQMDAGFREEVNKKLPQGRKLQNPRLRPKQNQFRVVFAIISDRRGDLKLPFFSRLNLKHATRRLEAYGFRVAKAKIDVNEAFSKTAKFRSRKRT
jgi:Family of unknown function (DUF6119)